MTPYSIVDKFQGFLKDLPPTHTRISQVYPDNGDKKTILTVAVVLPSVA
jgi:hypothetical protein